LIKLACFSFPILSDLYERKDVLDHPYEEIVPEAIIQAASLTGMVEGKVQ
jgi:hypothetical protein